MKHRLMPRVLLSLLGLIFILWAIGNIALGVIGEKANAVITHIRREGGERTDGRPGRYTYNISYTFELPDGREVNGYAKEIGSSVFVKADGSSTTPVRYFPQFPYYNAREKDTGLGARQLILIVTGGFLIVFMNSSKSFA